MTIDEAISHEERNVEINKLIGEVSDCEPTNAIAYHRQLAEWLKELKRLREQTRWIPVSERLPETVDYYLTSIAHSDGTKKAVISWFDGMSFKAEVKAWMPLPEPYKAESEVGE